MVTALLLGLLAGAGVATILLALLRPATAAARPVEHRIGRRLREDLTRAGLERVPAGAFLAIALVVGAIVGAAALLATGILVLGCLGLLVGVWSAFALVRLRSAQRRCSNRAHWPDVVDHLIASVRSGFGLPDAIEQLGRSGPEPLREDMRTFTAHYRATGSFDLAVDEAKERFADPVADRLLETLRMAREVGGTELVGVLRAFSGFLREEQAVRHEAEARQSWVRGAARLGVVAPWVVLVMLATRPEAAAAYNTAGGMTVILVGLGVTLVAYRLMMALGRLREEGRWFA